MPHLGKATVPSRTTLPFVPMNVVFVCVVRLIMFRIFNIMCVDVDTGDRTRRVVKIVYESARKVDCGKTNPLLH